MQQERALELLMRQLKDIQVQADKILSGDDSGEAVENFAKYSAELKVYITKNVGEPKIQTYLKELPEVNYQRVNIKLWQYLVLPSWFIAWYHDQQQKKRTLEDISMVRGKYGTLELMVRELTY